MTARRSRAGTRRTQGNGKPHRLRNAPWAVDELNRLLASARTMPGDVGGYRADRWWPALILAQLDTGAKIGDVIAAKRDAYERETGTLAVGLFVYELHALTVEALECLHSRRGLGQPSLSQATGPGPARLFPWPFDNGRPPFHMLLRNYRIVLYRAGLPHVRYNLFDRLRITARNRDSVFAAIDVKSPVNLIEGQPQLPRGP